MSPILAEQIINYVGAVNSSKPQPIGYGYALVIILFLLQLLGSFCLNYYFQVTMVVGQSARTTLISVIYRKMLRLDERARLDFSGGKIINMVSSDVSRIDMISGYLHNIWSAPFQLLVTIALLINALG